MLLAAEAEAHPLPHLTIRDDRKIGCSRRSRCGASGPPNWISPGFPCPPGPRCSSTSKESTLTPSAIQRPTCWTPTVGTCPISPFGDGPHACIGARLAQLEARVLVDVLREDFPDAHLAVPFNELERDRSGQQSRLLASLPTWLRSG